MFGRKLRFAVGICVHNEEDYITYCLRAIYDFADVIVVSINTGIPWGGNSEPLDGTLDLVKSFPDPMGKLHILTGEWSGETEQRNANLDAVRNEVDYYMVIDADEIYHSDDLARIKRFVAWRPYIGQFRIRLNTYWKINPFNIIDPPEPLKAYIITKVTPKTMFVGLRRTNESWRCVIPRHVAVCNHFSYARPAEKILQKLRNFSHKDELVHDWFENIWLRWDENQSIEDLHPTKPEEYKRAIPVELNSLPEVMRVHRFAEFKED